MITDALVGSALAPYFIFPVPGGLPMGWLWKFGVSTQLQIVSTVELLMCGKERHRQILRDSFSLKQLVFEKNCESLGKGKRHDRDMTGNFYAGDR